MTAGTLATGSDWSLNEWSAACCAAIWIVLIIAAILMSKE